MASLSSSRPAPRRRGTVLLEALFAIVVVAIVLLLAAPTMERTDLGVRAQRATDAQFVALRALVANYAAKPTADVLALPTSGATLAVDALPVSVGLDADAPGAHIPRVRFVAQDPTPNGAPPDTMTLELSGAFQPLTAGRNVGETRP